MVKSKSKSTIKRVHLWYGHLNPRSCQTTGSFVLHRTPPKENQWWVNCINDQPFFGGSWWGTPWPWWGKLSPARHTHCCPHPPRPRCPPAHQKYQHHYGLSSFPHIFQVKVRLKCWWCTSSYTIPHYSQGSENTDTLEKHIFMNVKQK